MPLLKMCYFNRLRLRVNSLEPPEMTLTVQVLQGGEL